MGDREVEVDIDTYTWLILSIKWTANDSILRSTGKYLKHGGYLNGKEVQKPWDVCVYRTDSFSVQ